MNSVPFFDTISVTATFLIIVIGLGLLKAPKTTLTVLFIVTVITLAAATLVGGL